MGAKENDSRTGSTVALQEKGAHKHQKGFCKRILKFIFSHIGLVGMVILYSVAGGFLFELLEQHEEKRLCEEGKGQEGTNIVLLKSKLLTYIQFNITSNPADTTKDNETIANQVIESWLIEFRNQTHELKSKYKFTGSCDSPRWNFPGALLFAITAITTIGYGHIAPITWEGQIVCVCYATIGIPLFLMCVANISGVLGDMFRFAYSRIFCRLCYNKQKAKKNANGKTDNDEKNEKSVVSTVGVAPTWVKDGNASATGQNKVIDDPDFAAELKEDEDEEEEEEKVNVPLTITMIIITVYIGIGALLFHKFEDWTLVESGYFCYITLATIGFGDFVPGQRENDPFAGPKLVLGAIYVLFGMSIVAMCFDLMQEEIIAKFTWLGKKLGIVDEPAQQGEDEDEDEAVEPNKSSSQASLESNNNKTPRSVNDVKIRNAPLQYNVAENPTMSKFRNSITAKKQKLETKK